MLRHTTPTMIWHKFFRLLTRIKEVNEIKFEGWQNNSQCLGWVWKATMKIQLCHTQMKTKCSYSSDKSSQAHSTTAYMRQWTMSASVQVVACHLFGAKPLAEPIFLIVIWTPGNTLPTLGWYNVAVPLPWASVQWLVQCTMECHWNATGWPSVHWDTTGPPSEYLQGTLEHHWKKLVETAPHWNATGETKLNPAHTRMSLEKL